MGALIMEERERLIHGAPSPSPNVEDFGCDLIPPGTSMMWDGNWMPAVVSVTFPSRKNIIGVTHSTMFNK